MNAMEDLGFSVRIQARAEFLQHIHGLLGEYLHGLGVEESVIHELILALQEAMTNVVRHAYGDRKGGVGSLTVEAALDGSDVVMRTIDEGVPYDPTTREDPDLSVARTGGYGVFLIRSLTDRVEYVRKDDRNILTMIRKVCPRVVEAD